MQAAQLQTTGILTKIFLKNTIQKIEDDNKAQEKFSELEKSIPQVPQYQTAFVNNRSVDDHIFTVKRTLEEKWK